MDKSKNIAFMHIPKNAGTSFFYMLSTQYQPQERFDIQVIDNRRMNTHELRALPRKQRANIKLVSGHFKYGIHQHLVGDTDYVTFLRDPVKRIISFYKFVLSQPNHGLHQEVASKNMSLYDFVTRMQRGDINNAQVRMISGINDSAELMLEKAQENIDKHFSLVMLTEHFDKSLILFKRHYDVRKMRYLYSNRGAQPVNNPIIDEPTISAIREFNAGDIELYKLISADFASRWQAVPYKKLEAAQLKARNTVLNIRSRLNSFTE